MRTAMIFSLAVALAIVLLIGCGDDNGTNNGNGDDNHDQETGLAVEISPDSVVAIWCDWYSEWKYVFSIYINEETGSNVSLYEIKCTLKTSSELVYQDFTFSPYPTRMDVFFFVESGGSGHFRIFGESPQADTLPDIEEEGSLGFHISPTSLPANSQQRIDAYIYDPIGYDGYVLQIEFKGTTTSLDTVYGSGNAVLTIP
ncbi:hypothetical protein DRQ36_01560 [bacterium]|nr:MAG: hypothetical protein DRQ36_01560 [bacterium]